MDVSTAAVFSPRAARVPQLDRGLRVIHVGVLGLGNVGQAVVRAAGASAAPLAERGLALSIAGALVRDVTRPRRCASAGRVTSNVEAFMRGRYDVVIDALPGPDPAGGIVGRLLGKGTPVVSANKALIAAEGPRLRRVAARAGTSLRVEAAVIAGVPFLGGFERRPLAADVTRFAGILNGTSHFILTRMRAGALFASALAEAQALGYAEPDAEADISGRDSLQKLVVLAEVLLGCTVPLSSLSAGRIDVITPEALAAAETLGGAIKPIVFAARGPSSARLTVFAGPAWVPLSHPLAGVSGRDNAIVIDSRFSGRLVFAGPGAGPDVTAATLLDDAIEAVEEGGSLASAPQPRRPEPRTAARRAAVVRPPETPWFVRIAGASVQAAFVELQFRAAGLAVLKSATEASGVSLLIGAVSAGRMSAVAAALRTQGHTTHAWRVLDV